jgi:hypothetical protein
MSKRAASVAGVGLLAWTILLASQDLPLSSTFLLAVLMSMPFLALGARVEGDGDLSTPRRRWTLAAVIILAVVEMLTWDASVFAVALLSPVIAITAWFAAGPTTAGRPFASKAR